jgi:hypothetical protein
MKQSNYVMLSSKNRLDCGIGTHIGILGFPPTLRSTPGLYCGSIHFVEARPGESGGPLIDVEDGTVVGVTVKRYTKPIKFTSTIDIDYLRSFMEALP